MEPAFDTEAFKEKSIRSLNDDALQANLNGLQGRLQLGRFLAASGLPEFEAYRDLGRDIKNAAIARLPELLEQFETQVTARGGVVHWARDAEEARSIILKIAKDKKAKLAVKSKSMVSEEIDLGHALIEAGIRSVETDLGEYIVQLRDERPSHIVGPALHLSRVQVTETFKDAHKELDAERDIDDRVALIREARHVLRQDFANADIGITGANFLIAESGTAVVVTNEGNADLTALLPQTHIVLTGIEKVLPTYNDTAVLLRLLARSATGQDISSYTSFFSGPRQPGEEAGPTEFHVVLLDNGRANMVGTEFQDALRCIRCAACLNHCPVFGAIGGHGYGSVYSGPIGSVLSPALVGIEKSSDLPEASTLCGRCEEVCPVRIPLPKMLRHWREREFERNLTPTTFRWGVRLWSIVSSATWRYRIASRVARWALSMLSGNGGKIRSLPLAAGGFTEERDLKISKRATFQDAWSKGERR